MSIASQIKPSKGLAERIYVLYDEKVFAGRTTCPKNALHFLTRTNQGKLKVTCKVMTQSIMADVTADDLTMQIKADNRAAGQIKRKETLEKKKLETNDASSSLSKSYGAFA